MKIMNYNKFLIIEKLGANKDVELLSHYLKDKILNKSIIINNIPLKLSKPINKIIIDIGQKDYFDMSRSHSNINGYNLYFKFSPNPSIDIISHELNHAFQFIMKGKEKSLHDLDKLKSAKLAKGLLPFGYKNDKFNDIVDFIYYLSDAEIDSYVMETYSDIKELFKNYKIDKQTFISLINISTPYKICEYVDNINLNYYLKEISIEDKIIFFSILKEEEKRLKNINIKNNFFRKLSNLYNFFKIKINSNSVKKIEVDDISLIIDKWDKYFKIKSNKLKRKLFRLYDLLN